MNFGQWFFSFSRRERWGLILLSAICMLLFSIWLWIDSLPDPSGHWKVKYDATPAPITTSDEGTALVATDINTMTTTDWMRLGGLSKASCVAIVEYKNKLGGLVDISQIKEIVKIEDSTLKRWKKQTSCDAHKIKKIHIRRANLALLERHPYLGKGMAILLVDLSEDTTIKEPFAEVAKLVGETKLLRLKSYLIFD